MSSFKNDLHTLIKRDLELVIDNIQATPDNRLWEVPEGIRNSCGVLGQHIVGNLNHYIGKGIGDTAYIRQRDREFANTGISKEELITDLEELKDTLDIIFQNMEIDDLSSDYPLSIPFEASTGGILMHLYGHLNYHLGQLNYLRRILSSGK